MEVCIGCRIKWCRSLNPNLSLLIFSYLPFPCDKNSLFEMQKVHHKTLKVIYKYDTSYDNNPVIRLERFLSATTLVVFINKNIQKYCFREVQIESSCNLCPVLFIPFARPTIYGTNSVHFRESFIWNRLLQLNLG